MKNKAFTLSEVLITLAIIGIVAALTIPTVIRNYQKQQTVVRLKKIYSTLNQAYNNSQAENGSYESWDDSFTAGPSEYFKNYIKPYIKILKVCKTYQECNYQASFPWKYIKGTTYTEAAVNPASGISFITTDGIFVNMRTTGGSGASETFVRVDLNVEKEPNRLGRDVFVLRRTNKGIILECYNNTMDNINNNCSKTEYGTCCAAKIARDGWEIKENYPW